MGYCAAVVVGTEVGLPWCMRARSPLDAAHLEYPRRERRCVRAPCRGEQITREVRSYETTMSGLLELLAWLTEPVTISFCP